MRVVPGRVGGRACMMGPWDRMAVVGLLLLVQFVLGPFMVRVQAQLSELNARNDPQAGSSWSLSPNTQWTPSGSMRAMRAGSAPSQQERLIDCSR